MTWSHASVIKVLIAAWINLLVLTLKGDVTGCPGVTSTLCFMELEVEQVVDVGTHNLFIGRLVGGKDFRKGEPMTYAYYRKTR